MVSEVASWREGFRAGLAKVLFYLQSYFVMIKIDNLYTDMRSFFFFLGEISGLEWHHRGSRKSKRI